MASDSVTTTGKGEAASPYILLFEFEGAAIDGRAKLFAAAQKVFRDAGVELTDRQFARYCVHAAPPYVVDQLVADLGGDKLGDDAAAKIIAEYTARLRKEGGKVHPLFKAVLDEAGRRGIKATALTVLPEDVARDVLEKSGMASDQVELAFFSDKERHFPRTDCWLKVPRSMNKSSRACIAVAGSRDAGKSALSAGMRCLIVPDAFTAYQDFSGVDAVLDNLEDVELAALFDALT